MIQSNIDSFGDDIGRITNRITSMYEVRSRFDKDSKEYKALSYRIMCGQKFQQDSIDKAKGIISKPMPKYWYDRKSLMQMYHAGEITKQEFEFNMSIIAEKKPYFMKYIYPSLYKQYNQYIKNTSRKCLREFCLTIEDVESKENRGFDEDSFIEYYYRNMPVGISDCSMNLICKKIEDRFDGMPFMYKEEYEFDYNLLRSDEEYSVAQYRAIIAAYDRYNRRVKNYMSFTGSNREDKEEKSLNKASMVDEFKRECEIICPNEMALLNIMIDLLQEKKNTKQFVWDICSDTIIRVLLYKNSNEISYPVRDENGDISYSGRKFSMRKIKIDNGGVAHG